MIFIKYMFLHINCHYYLLENERVIHDLCALDFSLLNVILCLNNYRFRFIYYFNLNKYSFALFGYGMSDWEFTPLAPWILEVFLHYFSRCSACCLCLSSPRTAIIPVFGDLVLSIRSLTIYHFSSFFFCSLDGIVSVPLKSGLVILRPVQVCCWAILLNFLFLWLYFLIPKLLLGSSLAFLFFLPMLSLLVRRALDFP